MSPRTEEQYEKIRKKKKELILEAALKLFAQNSYHNTTINLIAKEAGVSKGLMYNYFKNKEELVRVLLIDSFNEHLVFIKRFGEIRDKKDFARFIDMIYAIIRAGKEHMRFYFSIIMQPDVMKIIEQEIMKTFEPYIKIIMDYYTIRGKENPMKEAMFFSAAMDGITIGYLNMPDLYKLDEIKDYIIEKFS